MSPFELTSTDPSRHKLSKKVRFGIFISVRYRVTNHAVIENLLKTSLHNSTLDEMKAQLLGERKTPCYSQWRCNYF